MNNSKIWLIIAFVLWLGLDTICAQSNPDEYRNLAAMYLWMDNCEKAQKCYNVYTELSGTKQEKLEAAIGQRCGRKTDGEYDIEYDWSKLLSYLSKTKIKDVDLIIRILSLYTDADERLAQLRNLESVYEPLARSLQGGGWYESIVVKKKL